MRITRSAAVLASLVVLVATQASAQSSIRQAREEAQRAYRRALAEARAAYQGRNRGPEQSDTLSRKVRIGRTGQVTVQNISGEITVSAGSGDEEYFLAFDQVVVPAVEQFKPELLLVSAGFDAHEEDPLAQMRVTADGFRELSRRCAALAPRVAAVLEGGYNSATLPRLVAAALEGFS